jgi:DNA-binding transcriptional LysR family regulator
MLHKKQETLGFYASPQYPIADSIAENDLKDIPLLLTEQDCNFRLMLVDALTKLSITPNIALETSSKEILKQFAANQLGVAFIPDMVVEKELINHTLKKLKWTGTEFPVFSQVFVHKDKHVNSAMKGLIEMIAEK